MRNEPLRWSIQNPLDILCLFLWFISSCPHDFIYNMFPISSTISTPIFFSSKRLHRQRTKAKGRNAYHGPGGIHMTKLVTVLPGLWAPCRWLGREGWQWHSGSPACYAHHLPNKPWHLGFKNKLAAEIKGWGCVDFLKQWLFKGKW